MSQHHHRREHNNCFLGITDAALRADIEYAKQLLALQWFQHNRDRLIAQGKAVSDLMECDLLEPPLDERRPGGEALVRRHVMVYFEPVLRRRFAGGWYSGVVDQWDPLRQNGMGLHHIAFRDGDQKWYNLDGDPKIRWELAEAQEQV